MIRVAISVEGQTEMEFCKKVLTPFFRSHNIEMIPIVVSTSRDRCGTKYKGGCINMDRIRSEVTRLLNSFDFVTTFYDFYGFNDRPTNDIDELEKKIFELFNDSRLIPYVQKYEFETLLFSKPEYYEDYFGNSRVTNKMKQIVQEFQEDIEKINDSPQTAPSKRMEKLFEEVGESYDKVFHGEGIAGDMGMTVLMSRATRFKNWIDKIAVLGDLND